MTKDFEEVSMEKAVSVYKAIENIWIIVDQIFRRGTAIGIETSQYGRTNQAIQRQLRGSLYDTK